MTSDHKCANCYVAQYGMESDVRCKNEWWYQWDYENRKMV
jgi:hypothetical protein